MTIIKRRQVMPVVLAALIFIAQTCSAQLLMSFNPAVQTGHQGDLLTYNSTLANTGVSTLYLNAINYNGLNSDIVLDPTLFFVNAPFFLSGGETWSGDVFTTQISPTATAGDYVGSFTVIGGTDPGALDDLASQTFQVTVAPIANVPEPGPVALGASAILILLLLAGRRIWQGQSGWLPKAG
jgi:hypothetical protein